MSPFIDVVGKMPSTNVSKPEPAIFTAWKYTSFSLYDNMYTLWFCAFKAFKNGMLSENRYCFPFEITSFTIFVASSML